MSPYVAQAGQSSCFSLPSAKITVCHNAQTNLHYFLFYLFYLPQKYQTALSMSLSGCLIITRLNLTQLHLHPDLTNPLCLHCLYQGLDQNLKLTQVILHSPTLHTSSSISSSIYAFKFCTSDPPTIPHFHCHYLFSQRLCSTLAPSQSNAK